jgi:hypothetical protein
LPILRFVFGPALEFFDLAILLELVLRGADLEREVILFETRVHTSEGRLKCALSGIGESAPIRDK